MTITFSKLRNDEGWGIRGDKESPGDQPPEPGKTIIVAKRSGEENEVIMGEVVAQGDDWWLAKIGSKPDSRPPGLRNVSGQLPPDPPYDENSTNWTEQRFAREEREEREAAEEQHRQERADALEAEVEDAARLADRRNELEDDPVEASSGFDWGEEQ